MLTLVADDLDRLTLHEVRPWHRLAARLRATSLDRALASGSDPERSVYLAARAMQLTSAKSRRHLAEGVRRALAEGADESPDIATSSGGRSPGTGARPAAGGRSAIGGESAGGGHWAIGGKSAVGGRSSGGGWSPRAPLRRAQIAAAAADLAALPGYLLASRPVPAQGVAMVHQLLSDGAGPLYRESRQADLRDAARRAAAALAR